MLQRKKVYSYSYCNNHFYSVLELLRWAKIVMFINDILLFMIVLLVEEDVCIKVSFTSELVKRKV